MPPRFYIAAPFFNPEQVALLQKIETAFTDAGVPFFSPRFQSGNKEKGPITPARAAEIFRINEVNIHDCEAMLAVLDWALPSYHELRVVKGFEFKGKGADCESASPPLAIPDSGTVYEMGYARAMNRPIVVYTERPPEAPLNLMLTQGARGVIRNEGELRDFLCLNDLQSRGRAVNWSILKPWEGRNS